MSEPANPDEHDDQEVPAPEDEADEAARLAAADPWTYKRAADLVQRAAKDKRLPAEDPPAPWFFATFPKR